MRLHLLFLFIPSLLLAQSENCTNQIDDNGNGLIDCYDPECYCELACVDHYLDQCKDSCLVPPVIDPVFEMQEFWTYSGDWHPYNVAITGDIDNDDIPEIIGKRGPFISGTGREYDQLLVINGATGQLEHILDVPSMKWAAGSVGIADLDQNGFAEIVMMNGNFFNGQDFSQIHNYEFNGSSFNKKWTSDVSVFYPSKINNLRYKPQFADFNADGIAEVYVLDKIFDGLSGELLCETGDERYLGKPNKIVFSQQHTITADILDDNFCPDCEGAEIIIGPIVYSVNIDRANRANCRITPQVTCPVQEDGINGIVDIDGDGDLDLVLLYGTFDNQTKITTWDGQTPNLLCPEYTINSDRGYCGLPTLADFDDDQIMDMALTTERRFNVLEFSNNGWSLKWEKINTDGSGQTGCTAFDFNGDNKIEILYRDENNFVIYNAEDGQELLSQPCSSGTGDEYPVVVDVDNDDQAELLLSCGNNLVCYESSGFRWRNTRKLWNQHIFHNTNVNDDLTIPGYDQNRAILDKDLFLNTFQMPYGSLFNRGVDYALKILDVECLVDKMAVDLSICNLGNYVNQDSVVVSFYNGSPFENSSVRSITKYSFLPLPKDSCFQTRITLNKLDQLYALVNDEGKEALPYSRSNFPFSNLQECIYSNNLDSQTISLDTIRIDTLILPADSVVLQGETFKDRGIYYLSKGNSSCDTIIKLNLRIATGHILYTFDDCRSNTKDGSSMDYSEFKPDSVINPNCAQLDGSIVYRENSTENKHSCTPGFMNSPAMCISSLDTCEYVAGHEKSLIVNVNVSPEKDSAIRFLAISFEHRAPVNYNWINGPSGLNNPPQYFGISVYKDGVPVLTVPQISTTNSWETYTAKMSGMDFSSIEEALFTVEILPYCLTGTASSVTAWDIENLELFFGCEKIKNNIFGSVVTWNQNPLPFTNIQIKDAIDDDIIMHTTTDRFGHLNVEYNSNIPFHLRGSRDDYKQENLNIKDILAIENHLKGTKPLIKAHQYIAADVNKSTSITMADVRELRKIVLGKKQKFNNKSDWETGSINEESPYSFYLPVIGQPGIQGLELLAIQTGDVSNNQSMYEEAISFIRSDRTTKLIVDDIMHVPGQTRIPIYSSDINIMSALQLSFLTSGIDEIKVENGLIHFDDEDIYIKNNFISIAHTTIDPIEIDKSQPLFYISGKVNRSARSNEIITQLFDKLLNIMLTTEEEMECILTFRKKEEEMNIRIFPNPSDGPVIFEINSSKLTPTLVSISDLNGKTISSEWLGSGSRPLNVRLMKSLQPGQYSYQIIQGEKILSGFITIIP